VGCPRSPTATYVKERTDMATAGPPRTDAYLLNSRTNPNFATAELELTDQFLVCRVTGHAGWLEKALDLPDLKDRLKAGEAITAFTIPRDRLSVKWLKQFLGGGFKVTDTEGKKWIVSLTYPSGALSLIDGLNERAKFKQWKQALANPGQ
jgi:hypothetical protein